MKYILGSLLVLALSACNTKDTSSGSSPTATPLSPASTVVQAVPASAFASASADSAPAVASGLPAASDIRYAVTRVASNDVLNVREKPHVASKKVYSFAPSVKGIRVTGQRQEKGGTPWVEVLFEGGTGWVNRTFLSEIKPGGGCNDPEVPALIRAFMKAVANSDGAALAATISPLSGLSFYPGERALRVSRAQAETIFTSNQVFNIGPGEGGPDITGTFKDLVTPSLRESILTKGAQEKCGKVLTGNGTGTPPTLESFQSAAVVSFFYPGQEEANNWVSWIGSIEYVESKPYFSSLKLFTRGI